MKTRTLVLTVLAALMPVACTEKTEKGLHVFPLESVTLASGSPLQERILRNQSRLESELYQPDRAIADDVNWPGDYVGRTILGVTMDARALHAEPRYLGEILRRLPGSRNAKGYLGGDFGKVINEQQLSGHGWLLRGLCE